MEKSSFEIVRCVMKDPEMEDIFRVRKAVFVEEQHVDRNEEFDSHEAASLHYLVRYNGKAAGTARWRFTEKGIKLERFAVLKELRSKGIGDAVLQQVLSDVCPLGKTIYLHAQVTALNFYKKAGFVQSGPLFVEANIDHYIMVFEG